MRSAVSFVRQACSGIFYGWWMVAAAFTLLGLAGGSYWFGFSVFFNAILEEFHWDRAVTALAFSLASLEGGVQGLFIGPLVDRFGPRKIMLVGTVLMGVGFFTLGLVNSLVSFYIVYMLFLGLGANAANGLPPQAAVANWFVRKRTMAFGILTMGWSVGGGILVPLLGLIVGVWGWRVAAMILSAAMFIVGIPLVMAIRGRPEDYGYRPDGDPPLPDEEASVLSDSPGGGSARASAPSPTVVDFTLVEAIKTKSFWTLGISFSMRNLALSAVTVHLVPLLVGRGFSVQGAANFAGLMALLGAPGRLLFGYAGDRVSKRALLTLAFVLQTAGIVVLMRATGPFHVYLFSLLMGLAWGCVPVLFAIRADYFGTRNYAAISGFMQALTAPSGLIGPFYAGWVYDTTHSYDSAFFVFIGVSIISVILGALSTAPRQKVAGQASPAIALEEVS